MTKPRLEYRQVEVSYNGVPAVYDVSFPVTPCEVVCIVGESGSGKSTLAKAAMGQLGSAGQVTRGDIFYEGSSIPDLPARELRRLCGGEFALVFQDCLAAWKTSNSGPTHTRATAFSSRACAWDLCFHAAGREGSLVERFGPSAGAFRSIRRMRALL